MFHALVLAATLATPTPTPAYTLDGAFSLYSAHTSPDATSLTDLSNGLLTLTKTGGQLRFAVTAGVYAFPTVGQPLVSTTQAGANTALYGYVPAYDLAYVPNAHVTVSVGQLASLLGQESGFTYQNINVQRGLLWAAETTFSRGVRVAYANGKITADLGYDDGFYSGNRGRAIDGLAGWSPSANTSWQFAFTLPGADTPGNATASVANKREYDLMLAQQVGKLQLLPYVLFVQSPASSTLGYTSSAHSTGVAVLANYAFSGAYSVGARFESYGNASVANDLSANADLVGYGPGSSATTWTITPAWHPGPFFARVDISNVTLHDFTPGLGFGKAGASNNQNRVVGELGVQF